MGFVFSTSVQKTWDEQWWIRSNPNVFFFPFSNDAFWEINIFHPVLEQLNLGAVSTTDASVNAKISLAQNSFDTTAFYYSECNKEISKYGVTDTFAFLVSKLFSISGLDPLKNCVAYGSYWQQTADHSADALDISLEKTTVRLSQSDSIFEKMGGFGICDEDYFGPGKSQCISALDHKFNTRMLLSEVEVYLSEFNQNSKEPIPSFENYKGIFDLIWTEEGVMAELDKADELANSSLKEANDAYSILSQEVKLKSSSVSDKLSYLSSQELRRITETSSATEFLGSDEFLTISERLSLAESAYSVSQDTHSMAATYFSISNLKLAIISLQTSKDSLSYVENEASSIDSNARVIVASKRSEAKELIDQLNPSGKDSADMANKANSDWSKAESSNVLGLKYEFYDSAAYYARLSMNKKIGQNDLVILSALKIEVEGLLKRAKTDAIDVSYEQSMFTHVKSREDAGDVAVLRDIEQSIFSSADLRYGHLAGERERLVEKAKLGGSQTSDLLSKLQTYNFYFANRVLDYNVAIGHLKAMAVDFAEIDSELDKSAKAIVSGGLESDANLFIGVVELDRPTEVILNVLIRNDYGYSAEDVNVIISVPQDVKFFKSDLSSGSDEVKSMIQSSNRITLVMKKILPFSIQEVIFSKSAIVAYSTKQSNKSTGRVDYSAEFSQTVAFDLDVDAPVVLEGSVDGKQYGGRVIKKGSHVLERTYFIQDAYSAETSNYRITNLGLNSIVEYDLTLFPRFDIDSTSVLLVRNTNSLIRSFKVSSLSGERISKKEDLGNGAYVVTMNDLKTNKPALLRVVIEIDDSSAYAANEIESLKSQVVDSDLQSMLQSAEQDLDSGNVDDSIKTIENIRNTINKREIEKLVSNKKKEDFAKVAAEELASYDSILSEARENDLSGAFFDVLSDKAKLLERAVAGNATEFDFSWKKTQVTAIKKQAFTEFNSLKKKYIEIGGQDEQYFYVFEQAYNKLSLSNDFNDVLPLLKSLKELNDFVESYSSSQISNGSKLKMQKDELDNKVKNLLVIYQKEYSDAKGSRLESLFTVDVKETDKLLKSTPSTATIASLNSTYANLKKTIDTLRSKANVNAADLERLAGDRFKEEILTIKELAQNGDFVKSMKEGDVLLAKMSKDKGDDKSLIILAVTALAILIALAYHLVSKKPNEPKKFRKLERVSS
ncbi:MAG: hypothetical protein ABII22_04785 [Candidatus Micrarchaeota archaeon]